MSYTALALCHFSAAKTAPCRFPPAPTAWNGTSSLLSGAHLLRGSLGSAQLCDPSMSWASIWCSEPTKGWKTQSCISGEPTNLWFRMLRKCSNCNCQSKSNIVAATWHSSGASAGSFCGVCSSSKLDIFTVAGPLAVGILVQDLEGFNQLGRKVPPLTGVTANALRSQNAKK